MPPHSSNNDAEQRRGNQVGFQDPCHSKVSLTLDIYNSLMIEDQNQAVEFWNGRIG